SIILIFFLTNSLIFSQLQSSNQKSEFWKNVQFGGGLTLNFGSGFSNVGVSPSAIYNVNQYFALGTGLQISYVSADNLYKSMIFGGSLIALVNPIQEIQISAELEQLNVNKTFYNNLYLKQNFWNTGLWLGAGYRTSNITIGGRYNVLFDKSKSVYSDAFMPFVRVYF
ncbi:MAG: hypothetical protein H7174_05600, partial [Flavobacterium sp.]|nr:hypothetical protein [Flavobacterium sp.]